MIALAYGLGLLVGLVIMYVMVVLPWKVAFKVLASDYRASESRILELEYSAKEKIHDN